jgi:hypothetical protein
MGDREVVWKEIEKESQKVEDWAAHSVDAWDYHLVA